MTDDEKKYLLTRLPAILASLEQESDRGCVLVVATMVEQCLERQILCRLLPAASSGGDELMSKSKNSPISSFSAKIDLSYRLGLIPEQERAIYHQLRELRNACAHEINEQRFSADRYKDRITNMVGHSAVLWEALRAAVERAGVTARPVESVKQLVRSARMALCLRALFQPGDRAQGGKPRSRDAHRRSARASP